MIKYLLDMDNNVRDIEIEVEDVFKEINRLGEITFILDKSLFDFDIEKEVFEGMDVYYVNRSSSFDKIIFFLHGGYYVFHAGNDPLIMLNKVIKATNVMVIIPIYSLAPFYGVNDNYDRMIRLFLKTQTDYQNKKICVMGESAGGGFSLALAEGVTKQPDELILLSPWVDLEMNNPDIKDYIALDPCLTVEMSKRCAKEYAKDVPLNDWRVSPINGDLSKLNNVSIFVGTNEIFYPDNTLLYEKIFEYNDINVSLYIGEGQVHVYPVTQTKEAQVALEQIINIVNR